MDPPSKKRRLAPKTNPSPTPAPHHVSPQQPAQAVRWTHAVPVASGPIIDIFSVRGHSR